jgi:hypothetical protein
MSSLAWIDFDEAERQRAQRIIRDDRHSASSLEAAIRGVRFRSTDSRYHALASLTDLVAYGEGLIAVLVPDGHRDRGRIAPHAGTGGAAYRSPLAREGFGTGLGSGVHGQISSANSWARCSARLNSIFSG